MTIGERIKARRHELSMSVETLSQKTGKNRATIYRYESNEIENMPVDVLVPLAKALDTTPAYLMGWEDYPFQIKEIAEREIGKSKSMIPIEDLNIRLKRAMNQKNTELVELSQKTGISENTLNKYLSGIASPNEDNIYLLGRTLDVSQDWLMGYDVPMEAKYYSRNYELSAEEECVITIFRHLNKIGQDRLVEYAMELNELSKYKLKQ